MTTDWLNMRASDADRQRTADILKAALVEGRLTAEEYSTRLDQAMAARTYGDLQRLTADLPTGVAPFGPSQPPPQPSAHAAPPAVPVAPQPPTKPINGMARASVILAALGFLTSGVTSVPAVILAHLSLHKIKRTGEGGNGRAVAALALGYVGIVILLVRMVVEVVGF